MEYKRDILRYARFHPAPSEIRNDPDVEALPSQSLTTIGVRND
jgi:hypothetical protein